MYHRVNDCLYVLKYVYEYAKMLNEFVNVDSLPVRIIPIVYDIRDVTKLLFLRKMAEVF